MITTYFRSSSLSDFNLCQHKFFINYVLGFRFPAGRAANVGTASHKALELLALRKFSEQKGLDKFIEKDTETEFVCESLDKQTAIMWAYLHYEEKFGFGPKELVDIEKHVNSVLDYRNGIYSPLNREIISPELFFDIELEEDWAKYEFEVKGEKLVGQLRLKGTMDLLSKLSETCYEMQDYKTGTFANKDWATGEEKNYKKLKNDVQLRLYSYVLSKLYPDKTIIMTLFFTNKDILGPRSIYFGPEDVPETLNILKGYFDKIKAVTHPKRIVPNFKCRFCPFSKEKFKDSGKTYCDFFHQEIKMSGIDKTVDSYILETVNDYEGGGKIIKDV